MHVATPLRTSQLKENQNAEEGKHIRVVARCAHLVCM